jgi:DNA-directed RNA polymerase III subunit RPC1
MKEQLRESKTPKKIGNVQFTRLSAEEVLRVSCMQVVSPNLYQPPSRNAHPNGPLDPRLGTSVKGQTCETCGKGMVECEGHFGHIALELPVYHIGYYKAIYNTLQKICKSCSRLLMTEEDIQTFRKRFLHKEASRVVLNKSVLEKVKRSSVCPHCGDYNGSIRKVGPFKMLHEKYVPLNPQTTDYAAAFATAYAEVKSLNVLIEQCKAQDDLTPMRVHKLFQNIRSSDCPVLDLDTEGGHP